MNTEGLAVLVADDEADMRQLVTRTLMASGRVRTVVSAANGAEAVAKAEEAVPDAVVLDISMPVMDGREALPRLRRLCPNSAIVVFSSRPSPHLLAELLEAGADAICDKASGIYELLAVLWTVVDRRAGAGGSG
ncbi:MAG TPA: response regulator transcription factor [Acidimicrobiales bacterium]|nr:response regulator transcription factor [Acidimicrobiales bacterium]